jgi:VanZ family protein
LYLTLAYTLLLVYGTLFPLNGWLTLDTSPWNLMLQRGPGNTSKADILTNLLVYMPFGLLLMRSLGNRSGSAHKIMLVTLASALLSLALEYLQAHLPGRVPSILDLVLNTLGGFSGALFALALRPDTAVGGKLYRIRSIYIHPGPLANLGLLALGLWALSQLSPLVPSIDLGNLRQGLKPLWHTLQNISTLEWVRVMEYSLSITAAGIISSTLLRTRYNALFLFTGFVSLVILLKVPVIGRQLSLEALLGLVFGLIITALVYDRPLRLRLSVAVIALAGMVLASGLYVPVDTAIISPAPFNWIPFRSHLTNNITGLIDILGSLWPFVALSFIAQLANSKHRLILMLTGSCIIFPLVFALEWNQQYLPGRSPDITDAIIATLAWLLPWFYPALSIQGTAETTVTETELKSTGRALPRYAMAAISALVLVVITTTVWQLDGKQVERPLDESKLAVLPAPEELPPVTLPDFRYKHPRLPAPNDADIGRLKLENPAWLRKHKERAADGEGKTYSAFITAYVEPGSLNLDILYQRLMALEITWRGHEQAKQIAVAYDWLYDQWTDEQRAGLQDKLVSNAAYLIKFIREKQRLSPYNVYLYNSPFQALIATALALYGDDPRGELVMRYSHDYWKNRVLPVWRQVMGSNGGWHEGGEYVGIGIGQAVYQVPAMWRKATGEDLFLSEPAIRGFLDFLIYRTRPDGTQFRWGDGAHFSKKVPDRIPLAIEYQHAAAYSLNGCPRRFEPTSWPWGPLPDNKLCDADALSRLPLSRYFDGIGMLVARSDWTDDASYITFKAGDNYWSHAHLDQGAFTIYKGGSLAIDSGAYGGGNGYGSDHHMNYAYQTIAHNTITVRDPEDTIAAPRKAREKDKEPRQFANDGGQRRIGSGWGIESAPLDLDEWQQKREIYHTGKIEKHFARDGLVAAVSDITPAYTNELSGQDTFSHRTRRVERLWRVFGYDSVDDVVVVFDQLRTSQPDFKKRWLLHTIETPERTDYGFSINRMPTDKPERSGGHLEGHVLLPKASETHIVGGTNAAFLADGTNYDEGGTFDESKLKRSNLEPGAWRIEISPETDSADALFLVVMLPASRSSSPQHRVRLLEEAGRIGCEITGPQRTTRWWFKTDANGFDIEIISPGKSNTTHPVWPE